MTPRKIAAVPGPVLARFDAVPSKSATHRGLAVAALAHGASVIRNPLLADDTRVTRDGLRALGVRIDERDGQWTVRGRPHGLPGGARIELGESGTSFRFLTALAALGEAPSTLHGSARLAERPIGELTRSLATLGADVRMTAEPASLPLTAGGRPPRGGRVSVSADRSSQFASALLLIGSRLPQGLDLDLPPPVVSLPYVRLTLDVLREFGIVPEECGLNRWKMSPEDSPGCRFTVEGDHSSASYFLAAPALVGGRVRVDGLRPGSSQPDARLGRDLARLGCRVQTGSTWIEVQGDGRVLPFDLDLSDAPDLAPTLAVLALAADGPCVLRGVEHLRLKESDRLEALAANLTLLGRRATAIEGRLEIDGLVPRHRGPIDASRARSVTVQTHSDHRLAMAFALAGLRIPGITLDDADCVGKSNPGFWIQFDALLAGSGT